MKTIVLTFCLFVSPSIWALHIQQVSIAPVSEQAVNVSLTTAADELYYFQSWEFSISGDVIIIDAQFICGFGSTIETLNNNFEIPIDGNQPLSYTLMIRAYYADADQLELQDEIRLSFNTPLAHSVNLLNEQFENSDEIALFPNPTTGEITVSGKPERMTVFDSHNREIRSDHKVRNKIYLSDLPEGIYQLFFFRGSMQIGRRIILKK